MSGNASQRQGDRKSKEIPEAGEEENGSGPVEKAGKRFHPDHTGRRKLGNGFGNAAGQLGTKAGSKGGLRQDVQFQPFRIDETQTEIRPGQSGRGEHTMNGPLTGGKPREQGTLRLHAVREPRQQARPGFLLRIFHSRQCGAPMDARLGQAGGSQRGQDAEFLDGPYAGAVLPRIGSVRTVAQGKVGSSFQQGKQVTLARITTAAIPGSHQS